MAWTLPISVLSSEFTTPAWLIFGTRLESLLRCAHRERLSLKHEMVNNVSVDISPGDSPSLRDALVAYEVEGNMDAEDDLPCTRWKMAGARTKELSTVGRRTRQERPKSPKTRPIRLLSCATKTCLGVTSCGVSLHQGDERKKWTLHMFWPQWPVLALLRRFVNAGGQLQDRAGVAGVHVDVRAGVTRF